MRNTNVPGGVVIASPALRSCLGTGAAVHWIHVHFEEIRYVPQTQYQTNRRGNRRPCRIVYHAGMDELYAPSARFEHAATVRQHVVQPFTLGAVRECHGAAAACRKDIDGCAIHTARLSTAMNDHSE